MSYFIFKGIDSRTFGVVSKSTFPPIAERAFKTTEIPGRAEPLNRLDVMRKNSKLAITMSILDTSKLAEINAWLQGDGDLILSNDLTKKYHAYVNQAITPDRLLKLCGSIPIVFTVEPFRYAVKNPYFANQMSMNDKVLTDSIEITYNGTCEGEPLLYFRFSGKLRITVNDSTEPLVISTANGTYTDTMLEAGLRGDEDSVYAYNYKSDAIYIDSAARVAYTPDKRVVINQTSGRFPTFKQGLNTVSFQLVVEEWKHNNRIYRSHNQELTSFDYYKNERWY